MKYAHILMAFASELWAIEPEKLAAITSFLAMQADGVKFSAEDIEAKIAPQTARAIARQEGAVAIIPVRGVISSRMNMMGNVSGGGGTSAEGLEQAIRAALADDGIKAIVLDIDSPGGAVLGTDEVAQLIASAKGTKPVIAQVSPRAASAAYWVACSAEEIVVTPSGEVGSIGVYTVHDDVSVALEKLGVKKTLIGAGRYKGEMQPFAPLADEAKAHVLSQVEAYYGMFVDRVASGRGVTSQAVRDGFGQGRMVMARDAVAQRMADRIGTMDETLTRLGVSRSVPAPSGRRSFAPQRERRALDL
ncbi:signal peptide peptidase SppA [Devosia sp. 1635]|uniref:signal peptide peptidase SppA n=1 Tax=Devosia sp. 1635 TaxID=2726066 RepID=UPI001566D9DF|nr:signal peptide peptidase SppA [Devosia sp. 1635]